MAYYGDQNTSLVVQFFFSMPFFLIFLRILIHISFHPEARTLDFLWHFPCQLESKEKRHLHSKNSCAKPVGSIDLPDCSSLITCFTSLKEKSKLKCFYDIFSLS